MEPERLKPPPTFYAESQKLYFTWRWSHALYRNPRFDNQEWESLEKSAVFIGFRPKWWEAESFYYDGHTTHYLTFLGLTVGKLFTWQAQRFFQPA